jgi:hypothetical protein
MVLIGRNKTRLEQIVTLYLEQALVLVIGMTGNAHSKWQTASNLKHKVMTSR